MPQRFFASDHHFNHDKILTFEKSKRNYSSLEEMKEDIIEKHNSVVKDDDTVTFLGDFIFGENPDYSVIHRMKGHKRLLLGNHDPAAKVKEYVKLFEKVEGSTDIRTKSGARYCVSHRPIHNWEMDVNMRYDFCIHGHLHGKLIDDPRYINVCMEHINMTPISFDEIRDILRKEDLKMSKLSKISDKDLKKQISQMNNAYAQLQKEIRKLRNDISKLETTRGDIFAKQCRLEIELNDRKNMIPTTGKFICYKRIYSTNSNKVKLIAKLEVPATAKRAAFGGHHGYKSRVSEAKVLDIFNPKTLKKHKVGYAGTSDKDDNKLKYEVGKTVFPDSFDDNLFKQCSNGIHVFKALKLAKSY